jgi:FAD/FMN-containing dehydrogenase
VSTGEGLGAHAHRATTGDLLAIATDIGVRQSFARDASGLELVPESVARPTSEAQVVHVLRSAHAAWLPVTPAGGQTSTTGASITDRGMLLSLRGLTDVGDVDRERLTIRVQAGVLVGDLKRRLAAEELLFSPDPTSEDDVTIGGAIACNASGARSLLYGPTRPHVVSLRVALADGSVHELHRTRLEKNTVGYAPVHDPIDWFIGSEGTLGVILEAELSLRPLPPNVTGLAVPFPGENEALDFIIAARTSPAVSPRCLEYFDSLALDVARTAEDAAGWAEGAGALVYLEQAAAAGSDVPLDEWLGLAERHGAAENDIVVYESPSALRDARRLRHRVPTTMIERGNRYRPAGGRRVSTDWAVPYRRLKDAIRESRRLAEKAGIGQPVVYGHAGNGHPHQNFIARDAAELARMEAVVEATLRHVIALGGTVAAEHGTGKIKRRWLPLQLTPMQLGMMGAIKRELDPRGLLAPGNLFELRG